MEKKFIIRFYILESKKLKLCFPIERALPLGFSAQTEWQDCLGTKNFTWQVMNGRQEKLTHRGYGSLGCTDPSVVALPLPTFFWRPAIYFQYVQDVLCYHRDGHFQDCDSRDFVMFAFLTNAKRTTHRTFTPGYPEKGTCIRFICKIADISQLCVKNAPLLFSSLANQKILQKETQGRDFEIERNPE